MPTTGQAIRDAIEAELAAARFYDDLAARTDDARARRFLEDLAEVEHAHGSEIHAAAKALLLGELPDFPQDDAEDIETLAEWRDADGVTIDEALEIAIACERKANAHYQSWAMRLEGRSAEFFQNLARAESQHERMIEHVLSQRVASQRARLPLPQIGRNIAEAERASARMYRRLAACHVDARVGRFLAGMAEVQDVTAAEAERRVVELTSAPLAHKSNLAPRRFECVPGVLVEEMLGIGAAMRLARDAELRSALVYRSMSRYVADSEAELVMEFARAEEAHARSIEDALKLAV